MVSVSEMIDLMWRPPHRGPDFKKPRLDRMLPENFEYYGNWGFTIYRTYYSSESDKHWDILLDALKRQTYLALGYYESEDEYEYELERRRIWFHGGRTKEGYMDDLKRLKKLFHLEPREDISLLDGLDIRQLREVCLREDPEAEKTMASGQFRFVLLADEAVLKDIAKDIFVVKAVNYGWEEAHHTPWGWIRMRTSHVLELWHSLMMGKHSCYLSLDFKGPEEDLEHDIWDGELAASSTGTCSEVEPWTYHIPKPLIRIEKEELLQDE